MLTDFRYKGLNHEVNKQQPPRQRPPSQQVSVAAGPLTRTMPRRVIGSPPLPPSQHRRRPSSLWSDYYYESHDGGLHKLFPQLGALPTLHLLCGRPNVPTSPHLVGIFESHQDFFFLWCFDFNFKQVSFFFWPSMQITHIPPKDPICI